MVQGSIATQRIRILMTAWGSCSCQAQHLHAIIYIKLSLFPCLRLFPSLEPIPCNNHEAC